MKQMRPSPSLIPPVIAGTIAMMGELESLMKVEDEMVSLRKLESYQELNRRKQKLTLDYQTNIKAIIAQPDLLKQLPEDVRKALKVAGERLAAATMHNALVLRGAVMASQRLIHNIVAIIKEEVMPKQGYTNPRTSRLALGNYSPTCAPVSVSRKV